MPPSRERIPPNTIIASSFFVAVFGAYHLGKRVGNLHRENISDSTMTRFRVFLVSLLSFSFTSSSTTGFSPPSIPRKANLNGQSELASVTEGGNQADVEASKEATKAEDDLLKSKRHAEVPLESITMQPIGHISSVYRLCVGTPRQGLLAPNSRGRIDLYPNRISSNSILELDSFSHVWVVFIFHLNSNQKSMERSKQKIEGDKVIKRQFKAKIKPPALGGKSVGIFASRSPHRPNPVGFSLCKIDKIVIPPKKKHQRLNNDPYHVYVSGLDLVDGTPILDIKPYVPHYDSVGYMKEEGRDDEVHLPKWVSDGLGKRREVEFTSEAQQQLKDIMMGDDRGELEFYGKSTGRDETEEEAFESVRKCISEVLSVDVRSKWQTSKARKGKSQAERAKRVKALKKSSIDDKPEASKIIGETDKNDHTATSNMSDNFCTQQLDRLLVKYTVRENVVQNSSDVVDTHGSGADDGIIVVGVELIPK